MVDLAGISSTAVNISVIVFTLLFVGAVMVGCVFLYLRWKRYDQFRCVVFEKDGFGQLCEGFDKAGIFVDKKTSNKRFFMKKNNVGLNPDNIPYLPMGNKKVVYLLRVGLKNFRFIKFNINTGRFNISVGEEDVNWGINAYERQKKLFSQSLLMQLMPYIAIAFVSIIILTIFIYFFKEFATLKEMAQALAEMSSNIAQAKSGTTVITGG